MALDLQAAQRMCLRRMINFNLPVEEGTLSAFSGEWKVLVYDDYCKDIMTPLLTVNDLRKQGVTLNLSLGAVRQPISDVPAVYFIQPNAEVRPPREARSGGGGGGGCYRSGTVFVGSFGLCF